MNNEKMLYCQKTIDQYDRNINENGQIPDDRYPSWEKILLPYLKEGDHILDLGCGTGHYSLVFQRLGFKVSALDASAACCRIASERLGIPVQNLRFDQLSDVALYDACGHAALSSIFQDERCRTLFPASLPPLSPRGTFTPVLWKAMRKNGENKEALSWPT